MSDDVKVTDTTLDLKYLEVRAVGKPYYHGDPENQEAKEYYDLWAGSLRQANRWRGIAAAMGYEPNAHDNVKPREKWLLDRIKKYRLQAAQTSTADLQAQLAEARAEVERSASDRSALFARINRLHTTLDCFQRVLDFDIDGACPICAGVEGCSHTLPERIGAAIGTLTGDAT